MQAKAEKLKSSLKTVKKDIIKPEKLKYKPLTGKVFYLDIPSNVISEKLEKDLKDLGGKVEGFLSKDISYLISTKKEAKFAPTLGQISPAPSPESAQNGGNSSPHPSSRRDRHDGNSFKTADAVRMSRGKSLVEKAIKEQELIPSGSILSNALSWGVKILHIDDIKNYIEQKKKELYLVKKASSSKDVGKRCAVQKSRSKLKNPFVKVEDRSRHYRPFYLQLPNFPILNYCVPKPYSPFEADKKHPCGQKQAQAKQRNKTNSEKDCGTPVQLPQKDKKKRGYCECCGKKYEDLQSHLESEQHRSFAQSTQYHVVDEIISKFAYEFVQYKDDAKVIERTKCSSGYFSPIIGKVAKPDELKERLKRQCFSLKSNSWKDSTMQVLKVDHWPTEVHSNSMPVPPPPSGYASSVLHCHLSQLSEAKGKLRNNVENSKTDSNIKETILSSSFIQLLPQKDDKANIKNLSQASEPFSKEIFEPEVPRKDLQSLQEGVCSLHSHTQGTDFTKKDKTLPQPKRKLNNAVLQPAKCLKKMDANPVLIKKHHDLYDDHQQLEHNVVLDMNASGTAASKELNGWAASTAPSSPSGKLHRKVKLCLGKHKREKWKQNVELSGKNADGLSMSEEKKSACSSPVQALLELFQTSEVNSDFGGFSSFTENRDLTSIKDIWEGPSTNVAWSLFSSSSSSPFIGF
ncbi:Protein DBF4 A [Tinamus guttatus]|uniref:Protein DBF4 homolog A n=1 Tax=Tinamus guttatus TaxID=94827 RepID=A0A099ZQE3_TINGU|nr:Protein DBF4 A [Tinamus guttatus]